jgi:hypothetical protein
MPGKGPPSYKNAPAELARSKKERKKERKREGTKEIKDESTPRDFVLIGQYMCSDWLSSCYSMVRVENEKVALRYNLFQNED